MSGYIQRGISPDMALRAVGGYVDEMRESGVDLTVPERIVIVYDTCILGKRTEDVLREADLYRGMGYDVGVCPEVKKEIRILGKYGWKNFHDRSHVGLSRKKLGELSGILGNVINGNGEKYKCVDRIDPAGNLSRADKMQASANSDELRIAITLDMGFIDAVKGMNARGAINVAAGQDCETALKNYMNELELWEYLCDI